MLFDADELADMRGDMAEFLVDSCQVQRSIPTRDSGGGTVDAFALTNTYPCRLHNGQSPRDLALRDVSDSVTPISIWKVILPWNADVRAGDQLQSGALLLSVSGVDAGKSDALCLVAICKKV